MLEDLRKDLGIPLEDNDADSVGLTSTRTWSPEELAAATKTISIPHESNARASRRKGSNMTNGDLLMTTQKITLPTLRPSKRGGDGKPPLPRPGSRGSRSRPGSSCSKTDLQEVKEVREENDAEANDPPSADILTIQHEEPEAVANGIDEKARNGESEDFTLQETLTSVDDGMVDTLKAELLDYEDTYEEKLEDEYDDEFEAEEEEEKPRPQPRKRSAITPRSDLKETPRSNGVTSESVTVSELDENDSSLY